MPRRRAPAPAPAPTGVQRKAPTDSSPSLSSPSPPPPPPLPKGKTWSQLLELQKYPISSMTKADRLYKHLVPYLMHYHGDHAKTSLSGRKYTNGSCNCLHKLHQNRDNCVAVAEYIIYFSSKPKQERDALLMEKIAAANVIAKQDIDQQKTEQELTSLRQQHRTLEEKYYQLLRKIELKDTQMYEQQKENKNQLSPEQTQFENGRNDNENENDNSGNENDDGDENDGTNNKTAKKKSNKNRNEKIRYSSSSNSSDGNDNEKNDNTTVNDQNGYCEETATSTRAFPSVKKAYYALPFLIVKEEDEEKDKDTENRDSRENSNNHKTDQINQNSPSTTPSPPPIDYKKVAKSLQDTPICQLALMWLLRIGKNGWTTCSQAVRDGSGVPKHRLIGMPRKRKTFFLEPQLRGHFQELQHFFARPYKKRRGGGGGATELGPHERIDENDDSILFKLDPNEWTKRKCYARFCWESGFVVKTDKIGRVSHTRRTDEEWNNLQRHRGGIVGAGSGTIPGTAAPNGQQPGQDNAHTRDPVLLTAAALLASSTASMKNNNQHNIPNNKNTMANAFAIATGASPEGEEGGTDLSTNATAENTMNGNDNNNCNVVEENNTRTASTITKTTFDTPLSWRSYLKYWTVNFPKLKIEP